MVDMRAESAAAFVRSRRLATAIAPDRPFLRVLRLQDARGLCDTLDALHPALLLVRPIYILMHHAFSHFSSTRPGRTSDVTSMRSTVRSSVSSMRRRKDCSVMSVNQRPLRMPS